MIPQPIIDYLEGRGFSYERLPHPLAITAQELAAVLHVPGKYVAKCVIVEAEAERYLTVLPAPDRLDEQRLADVLDARSVRLLLSEEELAALFPGCEVGAEPPFGRLYDMRVILDEALADRDASLVFRAGSHTEAIGMRYIDYERIERPMIAGITRSTAPFLAGTVPAPQLRI